MADIHCPHCGMPNPPEQNVCSFCQQPLHAPEDSTPIRPGDAPTNKKNTAELEPVLPGWLRDARANARRAEAENVAEEAQSAAESPAPKEEAPDLLAGLASASREEQDDEIPEWMRGAAPISAPLPAPAKPEKTENTFPRRQEIHWGDETESEMGGMATLPIPSAPESGDDLLPWMHGAEEEPAEEKDGVSNWLAGQTSASQEQTPVSPFASGTVQPPSTGELTNWLDKAVGPESAAPDEESAAKSDDSLGNWLSSLPSGDVSPAPAESSETFGEDIDLPDWMKPTVASQEKADEPPALDWLKPTVEPFTTPSEKQDTTPAPDWMTAFREQELPAESSAHLTEPAPEVTSAPAFVPGEETLDSSQGDELFAAEMPDWLSNIAPTDQKSASTEAQEQIAPADLPSWVQAMRPVESVLPGSSITVPSAEGPLEENGPLAGLRGVLPMAGLIQPGKPKAQGIRLQASESQQSNANLLEQMLAAETKAEPIRGGGTLVSQRVLRWVISAMLILLVTLVLLSGSQSVPLPAALPEESNLMLPVLDALPEGAPVLMIFDYEPALAGELEAAAAPFVDHVIGLRHPRMTILSTSPTGAALAERFFANTQARHNYQPGQNYINLGYLPGGTTGILSFAENPRAAMPLPSWDSAAAQGVNRFSDYAAIILLTDQAETVRAWVEQTTAFRQGNPLLVVSSAQAAPMIQPYLLSGQVNGLVSGLYGGAAFEGSSGLGSPVRSYWDAYNFATLFVAMLIIFGGLWNLVAGARARRQGLGEA
jgi:hypothetical protein